VKIKKFFNYLKARWNGDRESELSIDSRWVLLPVMGLLAYIIGDVSLWVIILVCIGSFKIDLMI